MKKKQRDLFGKKIAKKLMDHNIKIETELDAECQKNIDAKLLEEK